MKKESVGTKKRGRPRKPDAMTPKQRKEKMRSENPAYEAHQKEKERTRDNILRFHIIRNIRYGYGIPHGIDQESEAFKRVKREYINQCEELVEVVEERDLSKHPHY